MKLVKFPFIGLSFGLFLIFIILIGRGTTSQGEAVLPLLTVLFVCEFAFVMTAIGAYIGFRNMRSVGFKTWYAMVSLLCFFMAIGLMLLGVELWSQLMAQIVVVES